MKQKFKIILSHAAELPTRNNPSDSGMDLRAKGYMKDGITHWFDEMTIKDISLMPNERILIKTGIQIKMPEKTWIDDNKNVHIVDIQVRPRSGLALKNGITVVNTPGTVDNGYINDIGVILLNTSGDTFVINENDRIAQMIITDCILTTNDDFEIVNSFDEKTDRGMAGFGDSGVK
jgi:dUTP pyrophosphatase